MKEIKKARKVRKQPVRALVRQARWICWVMLSGTKCCFCGEVLAIKADLKTLNNVTAHHIRGDKNKDVLSKPANPEMLLMAHSFCHKAFHLLDRMRSQGKNIDHKRLNRMERMVARQIKKNMRNR